MPVSAFNYEGFCAGKNLGSQTGNQTGTFVEEFLFGYGAVAVNHGNQIESIRG